MKALPGSRFLLIQSVFYLIAALMLLWVIEVTATYTTEGYQLRRLYASSPGSSRHIDAELDGARADIEHTQRSLEDMRSRRLPTLNNLREVARRFGHKLVRVERNPATSKRPSLGELYFVVVRGQALQNIQFLNQLENQFLVHADRVSLQAVDDRGQTVDLVLTLYLDEK